MEECKNILLDIQSSVSQVPDLINKISSIETKLDTLIQDVDSIGEVCVATTNFLQETVINNTLIPMEQAINVLLSNDKKALEGLNKGFGIVTDDSLKIYDLLKNSKDISLANNEYLKDIQSSSATHNLPISLLQSIANIEAISKQLNAVFLK